MIKDYDMICFSFSDWEKEMVSNRYHILTRFARNNRVFLFERTITFEKYDRHRLKYLLKPIRKKDGLYIIALPDSPGEITTQKNYRFYLSLIYSSFSVQNPIFWFYNYQLAYLIDEYKHTLSCYHCTEDYPHIAQLNSSDPQEFSKIEKMEKDFVKKNQLVFAVSESIKKRLNRYDKNIFLTTNACDYDLYRLGRGRPKRNFGSNPVLGYCGNLSIKVNFQLLYNLAKEMRNCNLILAGPLIYSDEYVTKLKKLPNVRFLGQLKIEEIPSLYREFDVCLLPYIQEDWFVKVAQPLKLYEYLATGKPVISTKMDCLKQVRGLVYQSTTIDEFVDAVKVALKEKNSNLSRKRIFKAKQNTWEQRFAFINQKMEEFLQKNAQK